MKLKEYEKITISDLNSHEEQTHIDDFLPTLIPKVHTLIFQEIGVEIKKLFDFAQEIYTVATRKHFLYLNFLSFFFYIFLFIEN